MELKPVIKRDEVVIAKLLIVPYGIETFFFLHQNTSQQTFNRTLWN